jgi:hypothetical protein
MTNQISTNYFGLDCVVYGTNRYVAYGEYSDWGVIMTSEDGKNWTVRSDGGASSGLSFSISLVYTGGRFFAVGGFGASATSTNGIDWTVFSGLGTATYGVTYGSTKYVAVGDSQSPYSDLNIFTSTDGVTWTAQHSTSVLKGTSLGDVAYGASTFVAIGFNNGYVNDSGHIYTSTTGTTWTQRAIPGGRYISYGRGIFIVPYAAGVNLLSSDGVNWTAQSTGIPGQLGKVNYANGLFMARADASLATSTDGTNWVQYPPAMPGNGLRGYYVATDGTRLVTVGGFYTNSGLPNYYNGYTYYSDVLAAVRITKTGSPRIALSGLVGRSYQIQSTDTLPAGTNNWRTNATLQLPSNPYVWTDTTATNTQRFYRGVLLP